MTEQKLEFMDGCFYLDDTIIKGMDAAQILYTREAALQAEVERLREALESALSHIVMADSRMYGEPSIVSAIQQALKESKS